MTEWYGNNPSSLNNYPILAMVDEVAQREGELRAGMLTRAMLCYAELLTLA